MAEAGTEGGVPPSGGDGGEAAEREPVPVMQRVLDNPFLLLFLGVTFPAVLYVVWGIMEVTQIPIAN